jgi:hypothetical protein
MMPKHEFVKKSSIVEDEAAFIEAIPGVVFSIVLSYVYLNVGTFMNGTMGSELTSAFGDASTRTQLENNSVDTLTNLSAYYDSNIAIVKIAITIAVLLVPIAAIMTLRRFT